MKVYVMSGLTIVGILVLGQMAGRYDAKPPMIEVSTTADDLIEAYSTNAQKADQDYGDKLIIVSGHTDGVHPGIFSGYTMNLGSFPWVEVNLAKGVDATQVHEGEVTVVCSHPSYNVSVRLNYCRGATEEEKARAIGDQDL